MYKNSFFTCLLLAVWFNIYSQSSSIQSKIDSITAYIEYSKDTDNIIEKRIEFAQRANEFSDQLKIDSIIIQTSRNLSRVYLANNDYEAYKNINHLTLKLATKIKDSSSIASANNNLGWYHYVQTQNDSAFFYYSRALKFYQVFNNINSQGRILLNMANIQEEEQDYIGAEINAFNAIRLIETLPENEGNLNSLCSLYNVIGLVSLASEDYDKAIEYHTQSLEYSKKMKDGYYPQLLAKMNLSLVYDEQGEYDKAIIVYNELLADNILLENDPDFYSKILNNLAYIKLINEKGTSSEIYELLRESYKINETLEDPVNKAGISASLAEYFLKENQKDSAFYYSNQALTLARETSSNDLVLESLVLMSRIKGGDEGLKYMGEYRILSDSLLQKERAYRNKFARVVYETDQLEADNAVLSKERFLFLLLSIGLMVLLTLLYVVITQRSKNRELRFAQQQQEANEEIYNLMLTQQDKVEEGRTNEKKRISQELHDGILGRLFGTRLSLDSLNMMHSEEAVQNREQYINQLKIIEEDIRKISHDLNTDFIGGSNFIDIVKTLIDTQTTAYDLEYDFVNDDHINWENIINKNKIHIYRMLQETMQNIYKHAQAKHINIGFALKNNVILLSIEDDGIGFNTDKAKKGIGIKNINSRVKELKGNVTIDSIINEGTTITISIPYNLN